MTKIRCFLERAEKAEAQLAAARRPRLCGCCEGQARSGTGAHGNGEGLRCACHNEGRAFAEDALRNTAAELAGKLADTEIELVAERERAEKLEKALLDLLAHHDATADVYGFSRSCGATTAAREALRPAAPSAQHVEMDEGESCSCGWTSHTKAWRAHAAHMRRCGETTSENSLPLGHEFEPCPSLMPDGFPARFCVLKSPKQTECHFWHLHPAHYCGQPESAHRRKP